MVLDLTTYVNNHPGGAFYLNQTIGRDISKYFYGSYALDDNQVNRCSNNNVHYHSNIGRKIAI